MARAHGSLSRGPYRVDDMIISVDKAQESQTNGQELEAGNQSDVLLPQAELSLVKRRCCDAVANALQLSNC